MIIDEPKVSPSGRYNLQQAANALEISKRTLYRMISTKKIKFDYRKSDGKRFIVGTEIIRIWQQTW